MDLLIPRSILRQGIDCWLLSATISVTPSGSDWNNQHSERHTKRDTQRETGDCHWHHQQCVVLRDVTQVTVCGCYVMSHRWQCGVLYLSSRMWKCRIWRQTTEVSCDRLEITSTGNQGQLPVDPCPTIIVGLVPPDYFPGSDTCASFTF